MCPGEPIPVRVETLEIPLNANGPSGRILDSTKKFEFIWARTHCNRSNDNKANKDSLKLTCLHTKPKSEEQQEPEQP